MHLPQTGQPTECLGTRVEDLQRHFDQAKRCGARIVHLPTNVPQLFAFAITMPNLTIQVRNDAWTKNPEDAQKTFDMLGTKDKEMIWVENTTPASEMATTTLDDIRRRS